MYVLEGEYYLEIPERGGGISGGNSIKEGQTLPGNSRAGGKYQVEIP